MPLENAKVGTPGFGRNIAREENAGKPPKQAEAIAYSKAGEKKDAVDFRDLKKQMDEWIAEEAKEPEHQKDAEKETYMVQFDVIDTSGKHHYNQTMRVHAASKSEAIIAAERRTKSMGLEFSTLKSARPENNHVRGDSVSSRLDACLDAARTITDAAWRAGRRDADKKEEPNKYNASAVNKEIAKDPRIKGKEAKMIHALLKGRH